ncbi:Protein angel 1 [Actinomortierella wolfii]|nr:Protein angel 1 [Actinomortierella wolfii]
MPSRVQAVTIKGVEFRRNAYAQRENVGIVALLDIKDGPRRRRVCVATTHILFNPRRGLIKLAQIRYLLDVARATVAAEDEDVPTIFCGDLNSFPESLVYEYLTTRKYRQYLEYV